MLSRFRTSVGVPILGIVENMAIHCCPNCGHTEHIFGADGGKRMATEYGVECLGGRPTVVSDPEGDIAAIYKAVAHKVAVKIAPKAGDFSTRLQTVSVSKST